MDAFERLAPFIREYIYQHKWNELYDMQRAACEVIFESDDNLLLSSATASGKTEAAFLPVLTMLYEKPPKSIGVLYLSPLKALINDQFERLSELLELADIDVQRWHGDVSASQKKALLARPRGILQITPESLESLLLNKTDRIISLFSDLRFVIIDEVHYFMESERGVQLACLLERLSRISGASPRRIGLSATLGDIEGAKKWLGAGSGRNTQAPAATAEKKKLGLLMQIFEHEHGGLEISSDEHKQFLYEKTLGKKSIIFAHTRSETEQIAGALRELSQKNHTPDVYRVHHGSISASLREATERDMKTGDIPLVTAATVTLELGIDIGTLERVVQVGAPQTCSSFTQRVGRCARRGQAAQLVFTLEESPRESGFTGKYINWEFIKTISVIELFLREKWIEPIAPPKRPYALLCHQSLSVLAANGSMSASELAKSVLTLSPFASIGKDDYRLLLQKMLSQELIERGENGALLVGKVGERLVSHFDFYSVFESKREYTVRSEHQIIGSLTASVTAGTCFALAGRSWEAVAVDENAAIIEARPAKFATEYLWSGMMAGETHTHILKKMREVLCGKENYAYLSARCVSRLNTYREAFYSAGLDKYTLIERSEGGAYLFPWLGTRGSETLCAAIRENGLAAKMLPSGELPIHIELTGAPIGIIEARLNSLLKKGVDKYALSIDENARLRYKYNEYVPSELLRAQFIEDYLDDTELDEAHIKIIRRT